MRAETFLGRIAARLGRRRQVETPPRQERGSPGFHRDRVMDEAERVETFAREFEAVEGVCKRVSSTEEAAAELRRLFAEADGPVAAHAPEAFAGWELERLWEETEPIVWRGGDGLAAAEFRARVADCDIGVTTASAAVAMSGSLLLQSGPDRPRSVSLLPRVHVALLRETDICTHLGEAMADVSNDPTSMTLFVTGPSRTSDIENDLSIGVHGPEAVIVLLLSEKSP